MIFFKKTIHCLYQSSPALFINIPKHVSKAVFENLPQKSPKPIPKHAKYHHLFLPDSSPSNTTNNNDNSLSISIRVPHPAAIPSRHRINFFRLLNPLDIGKSKTVFSSSIFNFDLNIGAILAMSGAQYYDLNLVCKQWYRLTPLHVAAKLKSSKLVKIIIFIFIIYILILFF